MYNWIEFGVVVEKGALLGVLKYTSGRVLEEYVAPYMSVIFDTKCQPTVYLGDWTYHFGRLV